MSVVAALTGSAREIDSDEGFRLFGPVLAPDERIQRAYILFRDAFVLADRRLILKDVQGLTGKKVEYHSLPYRSISHYSVETAGTWDLDAELKIYVSGNPTPVISKRFNRKLRVYDVLRVLAEHVDSVAL